MKNLFKKKITQQNKAEKIMEAEIEKAFNEKYEGYMFDDISDECVAYNSFKEQFLKNKEKQIYLDILSFLLNHIKVNFNLPEKFNKNNDKEILDLICNNEKISKEFNEYNKEINSDINTQNFGYIELINFLSFKLKNL